MSRSTALIRVRFSREILERLDRLREQLLVKTSRAVPRAALVRALVQAHMHTPEEQAALAKAIGEDPVKRGREKKNVPSLPNTVEPRIPLDG